MIIIHWVRGGGVNKALFLAGKCKVSLAGLTSPEHSCALRGEKFLASEVASTKSRIFIIIQIQLFKCEQKYLEIISIVVILIVIGITILLKN